MVMNLAEMVLSTPKSFAIQHTCWATMSIVTLQRYPLLRNYYAIIPSKSISHNLREFRVIQPEMILLKYFGPVTAWSLRTSIPGSMLQKTIRKQRTTTKLRNRPEDNSPRVILPSPLQKLVGDLNVWKGHFAGIFRTHKIKAQTFRENFGAFFVRKFVPRKNISCQLRSAVPP